MTVLFYYAQPINQVTWMKCVPFGSKIKNKKNCQTNHHPLCTPPPPPHFKRRRLYKCQKPAFYCLASRDHQSELEKRYQKNTWLSKQRRALNHNFTNCLKEFFRSLTEKRKYILQTLMSILSNFVLFWAKMAVKRWAWPKFSRPHMTGLLSEFSRGNMLHSGPNQCQLLVPPTHPYVESSSCKNEPTHQLKLSVKPTSWLQNHWARPNWLCPSLYTVNGPDGQNMFTTAVSVQTCNLTGIR